MVIIRLARGGSKKNPFYTLVVTDSHSPRDGRVIERIGFYDPIAKNKSERVRVSLDRAQYWLNNGAQLTYTVKRIIKNYSSQSIKSIEINKN